ncbi:MAG: hypothetical protein M3N12_07815 [Verrucomicrobiota bacterium]|nr:hypothetical protein [Verrucomicrobiota bacterium]
MIKFLAPDKVSEPPKMNQNYLSRAIVRILLASALTLLLITPRSGAEEKPFASYWIEFKAAVAKGDKERIASMMKFPFVYGGEQLSKAGFLKKFGTVFGQKMRKCFRDAKPVKDDKRDSYSVFCGSLIFVFEKVNGEYRLTDTGEND